MTIACQMFGGSYSIDEKHVQTGNMLNNATNSTIYNLNIAFLDDFVHKVVGSIVNGHDQPAYSPLKVESINIMVASLRHSNSQNYGDQRQRILASRIRPLPDKSFVVNLAQILQGLRLPPLKRSTRLFNVINHPAIQCNQGVKCLS